MQDLYCILSKGPWVVQNRLLVPHKWVPNTAMKLLHINIVDLWFKFTGIPMELISHTMGWKLGDLIGEPVSVDMSDEMPISMEGIRVKVLIDVSKPMPTGVFIPLTDNTLKWIACTPERVFRLCERCGHIGHLRGSCTKATHVIVAERRLKEMKSCRL